MNRSTFLLCSCLACVFLLVCGTEQAWAMQPDTTLCATPEPTTTIPADHSKRYFPSVEIPVVFHVLSDAAGTGNHTDATLYEQLDTLNVAFEPADISFRIVSINRLEDNNWFGMWGNGIAIALQLHVDVERVLNVYVGDTSPYGGWVYSLPGGSIPYYDGTFISYRGLPGDHAWQRDGDAFRGTGKDLVHEVGHWLGLYHTFQPSGSCPDGTYPACETNGDLICDTPAAENQCWLGDDCDATIRPWCIDSCPNEPGLDLLNNHMASPGLYCSREFTNGQYSRMLAIGGEFRPDVGLPIRYDRDLVFGSDESWEWFGTELQFDSGFGVDASGYFSADSTLFTASTGSGWDGILVKGQSGRLTFDGVIVEHADVGINVRSDNLSQIRNTLLTDNGVGLMGNLSLGGFAPGRSSFDLIQSCVVKSIYDPPNGLDYGHGIWGRWTDARIVDTTVEDNDGYGVFFTNADLSVAHGLLVTGNGAVSPNFQDGVRSGVNGDVTLASPFGGSGFYVGPDRNSIHDNNRDEMSIDDNGYATVGAGCGSSGCSAGNSVYGSFAQNGPYLINNRPPTTSIPAKRVFWGTNHNNPPDPDEDAFFDPNLITYKNPLSLNPASTAGRPSGCDPESFISSGSSSARSSSSSARSSSSGFPADAGEQGRGMDPETIAWLRNQIRAMRAALVQNPAADTAEALLGRLYGLQRLDRTDMLGEHGATMGLLTSLRARLLGGGSLPPALRATAEAALMAGLHDLMRSERYTEARSAVSRYGFHAELPRTQLALALTDVGLDEMDGDYVSAIARIDAILAELGPEHEQLAADLQATATLLAGEMDGEGFRPTEEPAYAASGVESLVAPAGFRLEAARPNPFNPQTVVPFTLDAPATVRIAVYDILGRQIAVLVEGRSDAGRHQAVFDGSGFPSGAYLIRASVQPENGDAGQTYTQRITLLK